MKSEELGVRSRGGSRTALKQGVIPGKCSATRNPGDFRPIRQEGTYMGRVSCRPLWQKGKKVELEVKGGEK